MRKAPVLTAAVAAALSLLCLPGSLDARPARSGKHVRAPRQAPARRAAQPNRQKGKTLIHQNGSGEVVIDRLEVAGLPEYGPSLPLETYNYPQLPCEPADAVIEVSLHETDSPAEAQVAEVVAEEASRSEPKSGFSRIARQFGSLFRPKSSAAEVRPQDVDLDVLLSHGFLIPVEGVDARKLQDSFLSSRGRHAQHLAIDIGAPRGTPVLATTNGEIVRVTRERRGGKAIYQKDASGQYLLFYCHLSRYAAGIAPGQRVAKGDVIGYVGSTGHVIGGPHLHFSITRMPEDGANFRKGLAINPYLLFLAGVP